jgi:hypothetical protein
MEQLSRPVDEDRLGGFLFGVLAWSFDEFAVDEGRAIQAPRMNSVMERWIGSATL